MSPQKPGEAGLIVSVCYSVANMGHTQNQAASFFLFVLLLCHFRTPHKRLGHDLDQISGHTVSIMPVLILVPQLNSKSS